MAFIQLRHGLVGTAIITLVLSMGLFTMGGATFKTILARRAPVRRTREEAVPAPASVDA
jgi:hypothetical protein